MLCALSWHPIVVSECMNARRSAIIVQISVKERCMGKAFDEG